MARTRVPAALSERLGPDATDGLVDVLESSRTEWTEQVLTLAEDRFERRLTLTEARFEGRLTLTEARFERRLAQEIAAFRVEITRELAAIRQEFTRELAAVRVELIRWSFVFWIGQVAVMIGVLAFMLRGVVR